jgi:hypothetical protein
MSASTNKLINSKNMKTSQALAADGSLETIPKRSIQDLVSKIDPNEKLDPEVEDVS